MGGTYQDLLPDYHTSNGYVWVPASEAENLECTLTPLTRAAEAAMARLEGLCRSAITMVESDGRRRTIHLIGAKTWDHVLNQPIEPDRLEPGGGV